MDSTASLDRDPKLFRSLNPSLAKNSAYVSSKDAFGVLKDNVSLNRIVLFLITTKHISYRENILSNVNNQ